MILLVLLLYTQVCHILCDVGVTSKSLDQFCSEEMGQNISFSKNTRLQKYLGICRDVDKYLQCVLNHRKQLIPSPQVVVEPYEIEFPSEYDLKAATYMFCSQDLVKMQHSFDSEAFSCEKQCDTVFCREKFVTQEALSRLKMLHTKSNESKAVVGNLSCSIAAPLTECIEDLYIQCNINYTIFRDYELGKLGGACLQAQKIYSPYVTYMGCGGECIHQGSNLIWSPGNLFALTSLIVLYNNWKN